MKKLTTALVLMVTLLPALSGCGRVRYPAYYTLNLPAPPDPPAAENVRTSIAVREFQSPNYLRQGPIVYRTTPEEIGFYEYHRWAADPRMLVTSAVVDHLRAGGQFSMVSMYDGRPNNDYVFSGRLEKLEEVDYEAGVKVEVAMSAQITRGRDRCNGLEQCCFRNSTGVSTKCTRGRVPNESDYGASHQQTPFYGSTVAGE